MIAGRLLQNLRLGAERSFSTTGHIMGKLDGKVAIVTASTEGIGFAIVKKLLADGAKVMLSSRKEKNVQRAVDDILKSGVSQDSVGGLVCHVGNSGDRLKLIDETAKRFGGIDILVSNAAVNPHFGSTMSCTEASWDKIFEINVKCAFLLAKEVHPYFEKRKAGSIVFVSSIAGFQPFSVLGPYSISKTALLGLTKVLANELAGDNIRVNSVCPGIIRTKFSSALTGSPEIHDKAIENIPMGRVGNPDEIGGIVSFLCSDEASYMTGENIIVAGGCPSRL